MFVSERKLGRWRQRRSRVVCVLYNINIATHNMISTQHVWFRVNVMAHHNKLASDNPGIIVNVLAES